MQTLEIKATESTPGVILDKINGIFEIKGKSTVELAQEFYTDILNWIEDYTKEPNSTTEFNFYLHSFNITSSKRILFLLYKLDKLRDLGYNVVVNWQYDDGDDDMLEVGNDYAFMVETPFNFLKTSEVLAKEPALA